MPGAVVCKNSTIRYAVSMTSHAVWAVPPASCRVRDMQPQMTAFGGCSHLQAQRFTRDYAAGGRVCSIRSQGKQRVDARLDDIDPSRSSAKHGKSQPTFPRRSAETWSSSTPHVMASHGESPSELRIALPSMGSPSLPHNLAGATPAPVKPRGGAAGRRCRSRLRYGRPLPEADQFLASYRTLRHPPQLVLLSVNLTARKPSKDTAEGNAYLSKSIARHRLAPASHSLLPGVWIIRAMAAGSAVNPFHHEADGRADRSHCLHRFHTMGRGR